MEDHQKSFWITTEEHEQICKKTWIKAGVIGFLLGTLVTIAAAINI